MDTSKNYIKMCEKAIELQEYWDPDYGDLYIKAHIPIYNEGVITIGRKR